MKVVAFIPIKLNNQRLPGKNTLPLGKKVACEHIFSTICDVNNIDERYVFCSDESIQQYIPEGIEFMKRETWLDGYQVKGLEIIENFVSLVDADIYVLTHVTAPFIKAESIRTAIQKIENEGYDSAFSAEKIQGYCWYEGKPVNYDMTNIKTTQNIEPIYLETGGFFIFKKEVFTKYHQRIGFNPYIHVIDRFEGVDIDTKEDYEFAQVVEAFLNKIGG